MKVIHILPGSGGMFYCENCMRDSALVRALRRRGHDVVMVPMYLPIYTDDATLADESPIFFGGVNCYLQQTFGVFRHTPRWMDRLFDARWILRAAARLSGSTRAAGLGEMTLSMLAGPDGRQAKEVARLVDWLAAPPGAGPDGDMQTAAAERRGPPVVGYLSRMGRKLGLDILVEAAIALKQTRPALSGLKLRAMGGRTGDDRTFVEGLRRRAKAAGMDADIEFLDEIDRSHRVEFLRGLTVMCVPMPGGEAFGTFIVEALAAGVPVVQPRLGGFTELVERTGGGLLYEPNDAATVARSLEVLLTDPTRARALGAAGRDAVLREYTVERMAERTEAVYAHVRACARQA